MKIGKLAYVAVFTLACWSGPSLATAVVPSTTYVQTSDHCTGDCGINTDNKVTFTDPITGDGLFSASVTLASGWAFQQTPSGMGHEASFAFSSSLSNLTFSGVSAGFTAIGPLASIHNDGLTHPASAYGFTTPDQQVHTSLSFNIDTHDTTLSLSGFLATLIAASGDALNPLFSADVLSANGKTGIIDFGSGTPSPVPLPGALLLLGSALAGGAGFAGLRRRRQRVVA
jgi:hypothetical protein